MTGQFCDALIVGAQQRNCSLLAGDGPGIPRRLGAPILSVDRHDGATCTQDHGVQGVADVEGRPILGVGLLPAVAERATLRQQHPGPCWRQGAVGDGVAVIDIRGQRVDARLGDCCHSAPASRARAAETSPISSASIPASSAMGAPSIRRAAWMGPS